MDYRIRTAEHRDLPFLIELCREHAAYEQAAYDPAGKMEKLEQALFGQEEKLFCLVVESNGVPVGFASYTFDFSTWDACTFLYLDCLYLQAAFRGFKIGEQVMQQLRGIAQDKGCVNIQWQTPVFNESAIRFYKRVGGIAKDKMRFCLPVNS